MSLRDFDRIYYTIEKRGSQTLIHPFTRIGYDATARTATIQQPVAPDNPITVELWQMAEQSDIDGYEWGEPKPATTQQVIDALILNSNSTPLIADGIEEQDVEGTHYDGHTARTFWEDEEVSLDDIRIAAYEEIDEDAADRGDDYLLVSDNDGTTIGMTLFPMDAEMLCGLLDKEIGEDTATAEYMSIKGIRRPIDLASVKYAVLEKIPRSLSWLLVGATDTLAHAEVIAQCREKGIYESGMTGEAIIKRVNR